MTRQTGSSARVPRQKRMAIALCFCYAIVAPLIPPQLCNIELLVLTQVFKVMVGTGTKKLTLEEFLALPEGDVNYEFVDGQAVPKVSPKFFHSTLQAALIVLMRAWSKRKGRVCPEWAILLKRQGEDWAPVPDLTYISYSRLPASWNRNEACPALPELVIEIISPDQTIKEFEDKAKDYFAAGVSRVWVVDPEKQSIKTFFPDGTNQVYTDNMPIIDTLLPGVELTTLQIFTEAELI